MKTRSILAPLFAVALLTACSISLPGKSSSSVSSSSTSTTSVTESSTTEPSSSTASSSSAEEFAYHIAEPNLSKKTYSSAQDLTYLDLFDLNNKISIDIDIDKEELEKIAEDNNIGHKPEIYRLAKNVKIQIDAGNDQVFEFNIDNVGVRQKGNTSRQSIFYGDTLNNRNHYKLSFDEGFNDVSIYGQDFVDRYGSKAREEREFLGLSGLDFKWDKNDDTTHVKEIYVNDVYRHAGIVCQHVGLSTIKMHYGDKTADFGLCYIYEPSSKSLIKNALSSGESFINMPSWSQEKKGTHGIEGKKYGDMYKCSYGHGDGSSEGADLTTDSMQGKKAGVKTDIYGNNYPTYERKTNKNDDYDDALLKQGIALFNKKGATYEEIASVVDMQYFAMEEACSYVLGNPDSFRNLYNNYIIYIRRTDGKWVFIPIDNDRALGIGKDWVDGLEFVLSNRSNSFYASTISGEQRNPLFLKTLLSKEGNTLKQDYLQCLDLIRASSWVKEETFNQYYSLAKTAYSNLANFDPRGGQDNISFAEAIVKKRN